MELLPRVRPKVVAIARGNLRRRRHTEQMWFVGSRDSVIKSSGSSPGCLFPDAVRSSMCILSVTLTQKNSQCSAVRDVCCMCDASFSVQVASIYMKTEESIIIGKDFAKKVRKHKAVYIWNALHTGNINLYNKNDSHIQYNCCNGALRHCYYYYYYYHHHYPRRHYYCFYCECYYYCCFLTLGKYSLKGVLKISGKCEDRYDIQSTKNKVNCHKPICNKIAL